MGRTLTAGGVMTPMWRALEDHGEAIEQSDDGRFKLVEPEPNDYVTPPDGVRAQMRLSGISEVFQMNSSFSDKPVDKVRVEFQMLKLAGGGNAGQAATGKRFTGLYSPTIGARSNLGKLFGRLRERDIEKDEELDIDAFIGTEFVAPIVVNAKGYAELIPETIERGKTKLSRFLTAPAPAPVPAGVSAGTDEDPFESGDDL